MMISPYQAWSTSATDDRRIHQCKVNLKRMAKSAENHCQTCRSCTSKRNLTDKPNKPESENASKEASRLIIGTSSYTNERWVALGLFCALACFQCCIWNTWGPIANNVMRAFPTWHQSLVALLSNWGCITYLTCCLPCCWMLNKKGIPVPIRIAAILTTMATFVRCLSSQDYVFTITAHIAAILNGLSGVIIGPATTLVSAVWFPRGERITATGISSVCNQLGMAVSYLVGPAVVGVQSRNDITSLIQNLPYTDDKNREKHSMSAIRQFHFLSSLKPSFNDTSDETALRVQIMSLMRIEFVAQFLILVGILVFFPKQRNHPIDALDGDTHFSLIESINYLIKSKSMWLLSLAAALSQGTTGPWLAMITIAFGTTISQDEADKLAFWTIIFSSILSLAASRISDMFQGHLKIAIYILLLTSSAMFLWVLLLDGKVLEFHKDELYAAVILGVSACWSTPALFLELASEIAFPVSEAIVGGYVIFLVNLVGTLFYFTYFLPGIGMHWSSCCVCGNLVVATLLIAYVRDDYNRTSFESTIESQTYSSANKNSYR